MGDCYYYGNGVRQSFSNAVFWYQKAVAQGDPAAQCSLGLCLLNGTGIEKDEVKAHKMVNCKPHVLAQRKTGSAKAAGGMVMAY